MSDEAFSFCPCLIRKAVDLSPLQVIQIEKLYKAPMEFLKVDHSFCGHRSERFAANNYWSSLLYDYSLMVT